MSNKKKSTTKKSTPKKVTTNKTTKPAPKKVEPKPVEKEKGFFSKYGAVVVIAALLVIFGAIIVGVKDDSKDADKAKGQLVSMEVSEWQTAIKEDTLIVTTLAQTTCSWCEKFKPVAQTVAKKYGVDIVWLNVNTLSQEDYTKLTGTFKELSEFGTPHTIITKNGKLVDQISGYVEESDFVSALQKNGVIK